MLKKKKEEEKKRWASYMMVLSLDEFLFRFEHSGEEKKKREKKRKEHSERDIFVSKVRMKIILYFVDIY